jgi:diaminopropionate ammonia-lyase
MRKLGAEVIRVAGNYDDSVDYAKRMAAKKNWLLISDTSDSPSDQGAAEVMQGYGAMCLELIEQFDGPLPTHVFVQAGVGGMAAAVAGSFAEFGGTSRPQITVVEPESAACVMQSAMNAGPCRIAGDLATNMAMLSCGETSAVAWVILSHRADAFMTVSDSAADDAVAWLRHTTDIPGGLLTTPSGAAGLAGLLAAAQDPQIRSHIGLTEHSRVLFFVTENV